MPLLLFNVWDIRDASESCYSFFLNLCPDRAGFEIFNSLAPQKKEKKRKYQCFWQIRGRDATYVAVGLILLQ